MSNSKSHSYPHISVMRQEFLDGFAGLPIHVFYEGTLGAGGHAEALLGAHPEIKTYIGCDKDPEAIELAQERLAPWKEKVVLIQGNFADLDRHLFELKIDHVDGFFLI